MREKISRNKIFVLWAFHENLTRGENVEDTGAFMAAMFITKPGRQLLEQLHHDGLPISAQIVRLYCWYGPRYPPDAVQMASSTSQFAAAIALDGIEDDNEPLGSGRLLQYFVIGKIFVHVIFPVTDNRENIFTAKISGMWFPQTCNPVQ